MGFLLTVSVMLRCAVVHRGKRSLPYEGENIKKMLTFTFVRIRIPSYVCLKRPCPSFKHE